MYNAFDYIVHNGITKDEDYPYTEKEGKCLREMKPHDAKTKIKGFIGHALAGEQSLLEVVAQQPVAVYTATNKNFDNYKSGIFGSGPKERLPENRAVIVIGYRGTGKDAYWLIKNSHCTGWGENDYEIEKARCLWHCYPSL